MAFLKRCQIIVKGMRSDVIVKNIRKSFELLKLLFQAINHFELRDLIGSLC